MKLLKYLLITVLMFVSLFLLAKVSRAIEPAKIIKVGTYNNQPKIYLEEGETKGVYADILNFIAQKENWKIEYDFGTWEEELTKLEKGEIDIMVDVAISGERQKRFDFTSETVMSSWGVVYVSQDSSIDSILDLNGKKVAILKSSVYEGGEEGIEHYLKAFGMNATLIESDYYSEVLNLVDLGIADAAIVSRIYGYAHRSEYPDLKATNIFLKPTELRFALTKGDRDNKYLIERIDFWVKKLKEGQDGFYNQVLSTYGLSDLFAPQGKKQKVVESLSYCALPTTLGILVASLVSGLGVLGFLSLKKIVNTSKTNLKNKVNKKS